MNPMYPDVARRAGGRCEYCHAPQRAFNFAFEVEHVAPSASGGSSSLDNLALACRSCNAYKSVRQTGVDPQTQAVAPLFHPRQDVWNNHFSFEEQTLMLTSVTPTGRATIILLKMNSDEQLVARQQWIRLELFP